MSTNYRRALATAVHCDLVDESPRELIKQLDELGLIAPDLLEPTTEDGKPEWGLDSYFDAVMIDNDTVCARVSSTLNVNLDLDEAEHLALALLAAIKWHKENQ